jgi:hypothetical protein
MESELEFLQKREALMDENLPEDYRIELAKAFVNDLFSKVKKCIDTVSSYARNEAQILPVIHLSQVLCIQLHPHSSLAPLCNFVCHPFPARPSLPSPSLHLVLFLSGVLLSLPIT